MKMKACTFPCVAIRPETSCFVATVDGGNTSWLVSSISPRVLRFAFEQKFKGTYTSEPGRASKNKASHFRLPVNFGPHYNSDSNIAFDMSTVVPISGAGDMFNPWGYQHIKDNQISVQQQGKPQPVYLHGILTMRYSIIVSYVMAVGRPPRDAHIALVWG